MTIESISLISVSSFILLVLLRCYLETVVLYDSFVLYAFSHFLFWYLSVLLWFLIPLKYIVKVPAKIMAFLPFAVIIVFIPMIYSFTSTEYSILQYIHVGDVRELAWHYATLMYFHPENKSLFWELVLLLAGYTSISFYFSHSLLKTTATVIVGFYISMMLFGSHLFGVKGATDACFPLETVLNNHKFLSLIYYSISLFLLTILFAKEINGQLRRKLNKHHMIDGFLGLLLFYSLTFFLSNRLNFQNFGIVDGLLLLFPTISAFLFFLSLFKYHSNSARVIFGAYTFSGLFLLIT